MTADPIDRCGIGVFSTDDNDPFARMCKVHDEAYILKEKGEETMSRKEVDKRFLNAMLIRAGKSRYLKARAYLYYGLARTLGHPFWLWI